MQGQQGETRQRLIDGARASIIDRGFADTSTRDVAAAARANIASITYHFGGKDALMEAALASCFAEWAGRLDETLAAASASATSPASYLRQVFVATVDSFDASAPEIIACIEAHAPALRSKSLRSALADGFAATRQRAVDALAAGLGMEGASGDEVAPLKHAISVVIALIDGLAIQWAADPSATPRSGDVINALRALGAVLDDTEYEHW